MTGWSFRRAREEGKGRIDQLLVDVHSSILVSRLPDAHSLGYSRFVVPSIIHIHLAPLILNLSSSAGVPMARQVVAARTHTSFALSLSVSKRAHTNHTTFSL